MAEEVVFPTSSGKYQMLYIKGEFSDGKWVPVDVQPPAPQYDLVVFSDGDITVTVE